MGSKGSNTTTTSSAPNGAAMAAYNDILNSAQTAAATPYTPYTGELVAGINPEQNTGIANINSNWNYAQPYLQTAAGMATNAAQPLTQSQIQAYMSPYTQDVVNSTQAQFNNQNQQQLQGVKGNAITQGALGGNREAIAEAELANQQQLAQAPVIAGLNNQAYTTGLNTALTEQQAQAQGAYSLGNLGVSGQNAALTGANAQFGAGTAQQQTQQAQDAAAYQQFINQLAYPFQTTQWLAGIGTGVGSQMGGSSSTTAPAPNTTAQWLGLGTAGAGAIGQAGGWAALGAMLANGGAVVARANGGVAPEERHITTPETPETLKLQQRQLLSGHRRVQMFPRGTPELPLPRGMNRVEHQNGAFHYDPRRIEARDINRLSNEGRENEMLDLGPYSKDDVLKRLHGGEIPVAVVERHPDGTEARAAIGTHTTVTRQMAAMNRTKSPGHIVRAEDPRETIGHRMRAMGGGVPGFALGGPPGSDGPWSSANGWVPTMSITPGRGAPQGGMTQARPAAPVMGKDSLPGLGDALKGVFSQQGVNNLATDKPNNGTGIYTGPANQPGFGGPGEAYAGSSSDPLPGLDASDYGEWTGGRVPRFADGGTPRTDGVGAMMFGQPHGGAHGWVPKMDMARGRGAPQAPGVAPLPASSIADQAKEIGSLAKLINSPQPASVNQGAGASADEENPSMYARGGSVRRKSGGVANLPIHFGVPHLADGGSPYDTDYFDETFAAPIRHDADSYSIASNPDRMAAYADAARANVIAENPDYVPMPRRRPEGIAPSYDLPPEITAGASRPSRGVSPVALGYAGDAPRPSAPVGADDLSAAANSAQGSSAIEAPRGVVPSSGIDLSANSKLWPSLMAAGFGMMASRSPFLGNAVGEGGMAGMQTYASERQREDKINSEVKKLSQEAEFAQKRLDLATRPYTDQTADQKARSAETAQYHKDLVNRMQLRPTGSMIEMPDGSQHPVLTDTRTGQSFDSITGEPVAADAKVVPGGGKPGATQVLARELMRDREEQRKTDPNLPPLSLEDAVNLAHRAPNGDQGTVRRLGMAQGAWKAWTSNPINMGKKDAPENSLEFWEKRYGVNGAAPAGAAPAPAARPTTPNPPAPPPPPMSEVAPQRPATVPADARAQRNKATGAFRWVSADGTIYSADGVKQ